MHKAGSILLIGLSLLAGLPPSAQAGRKAPEAKSPAACKEALSTEPGTGRPYYEIPRAAGGSYRIYTDFLPRSLGLPQTRVVDSAGQPITEPPIRFGRIDRRGMFLKVMELIEKRLPASLKMPILEHQFDKKAFRRLLESLYEAGVLDLKDLSRELKSDFKDFPLSTAALEFAQIRTIEIPKNPIVGLTRDLVCVGITFKDFDQVPFEIILYWDGKNVRGYLPTTGNPWNTDRDRPYQRDRFTEDSSNVKKRFPHLGALPFEDIELRLTVNWELVHRELTERFRPWIRRR